MTEGFFDYLDVSEFPAPEPLQMALEAGEQLTPGKFLHLHHRRYPRLLFGHLERRGFEYDTRCGPFDSCKVFIWRKEDNQAYQQVLIAAADYPGWPE
ncbi:MAG: DUF2249 domain-containing protein [Pseudomonadales bacterium]|nr:DUF2249 domain-containing protein [Pseudomonadales bacterium]